MLKVGHTFRKLHEHQNPRSIYEDYSKYNVSYKNQKASFQWVLSFWLLALDTKVETPNSTNIAQKCMLLGKEAYY